MCDKCKEIDAILEEGLGPTRKKIAAVQKRVDEEKGIDPEGRPSMFALALMQKALKEAVEEDDMGPMELIKMVEYSMAPYLAAAGMSTHMQVVDPKSKVGKEVVKALKAAGAVPADQPTATGGDDLLDSDDPFDVAKKGETWH